MSSSQNESFSQNWQTRKETLYTHWTREEPANQIQLAFRNHWLLFQELMNENPLFNKGKRVLEVGCGRGSLSCYFSDNNYQCSLVDLSENVIEVAKNIFSENKLTAELFVGDAGALPFEDNSFDIVFSIGLLEHFKDVDQIIKEQVRILDEGGIFIGYVVPEYFDNIQKDYHWINDILKGYKEESNNTSSKCDVYRSDYNSEYYIKLMKKYQLRDIQASGVYPLPMISHSINFPFTLMPENSEKAIVKHFTEVLETRNADFKQSPWLCKEGYGQAFLLWGVK